MSDINNFINGDGNNEATVLKSKIMSIMSSMEVMDEEKENIKEICGDLKEQHNITPKVAKAVAKLLKNPEKAQEIEDENFAIDKLLLQVSK